MNGIGSSPPALLAFGEDIATRGFREMDPESRIPELCQDALSSVAFDIGSRTETIKILEASAEDFLRLGRAWLTANSSHPWEAELDRQRQMTLTQVRQAPQLGTKFSPPSGYFGHAVWRPRHGGLETTSMADGWPTKWWIRYRWPSRAPLQIWTLAVEASARVLEIRLPGDWQRLTELYPCLVETSPLVEQPDVTLPAPLYLPDWSQVARDWDGVRVTMGGILETALVVLPVLDGYTVFNDQLADERTLWFHSVLTEAGPPETVLPFDGGRPPI